MDIVELPFNRLVGLVAEPSDSPYLVSLAGGPQHGNHLGTLHACALLMVAEVGSGVFLQRAMEQRGSYLPVVRRIEAKFRRPATGRVAARANVAPEQVMKWEQQLATRGRVWASVQIEVVDAAGEIVLTATIEWFIGKHAPAAGR